MYSTLGHGENSFAFVGLILFDCPMEAMQPCLPTYDFKPQKLRDGRDGRSMREG